MFWNEILMRIIYGEIMFNFYKGMIVVYWEIVKKSSFGQQKLIYQIDVDISNLSYFSNLIWNSCYAFYSNKFLSTKIFENLDQKINIK